MDGAVDPYQYSIDGLCSGSSGKGKHGSVPSTPGFMSISKYGRGSTRIKVDCTSNRGIDEGSYGLHNQIPKSQLLDSVEVKLLTSVEVLVL